MKTRINYTEKQHQALYNLARYEERLDKTDWSDTKKSISRCKVAIYDYMSIDGMTFADAFNEFEWALSVALKDDNVMMRELHIDLMRIVNIALTHK